MVACRTWGREPWTRTRDITTMIARIENEELRVGHLPARGAPVADLFRFGLTLDGYRVYDLEYLSSLFATEAANFHFRRVLSDSFVVLRAILFFAARSAHMTDQEPKGQELAFLHAVVEKLRSVVPAASQAAGSRPSSGAVTGSASSCLRIVAWNCNMAAHTKLDALLALKPDVLVLSECAAPDVRAARPLYLAASSHCWTGTYPIKGVAVFGFGDYTVEAVAPATSSGHHAVAVRVRGPISFNLLGLWTQGQGIRAYVESAQAALRDHDEFLRSAPSVVAGDFNSNAAWDKTTKGGHTNLVAMLDELGLVSAYHWRHGEVPGAESTATFFQNQKVEQPFQIDYVFIPKSWAPECGVEVGEPERWLRLSDHLPVIVATTT